MRLIDADALIKTIKGNIDIFCGLLLCRGNAISFLLGLIKNAPTIDTVEVVHGRCKWCNGDYHTTIMATAIRYHTNGNMDGYELKVNYCPNCGAKMDGERRDE